MGHKFYEVGPVIKFTRAGETWYKQEFYNHEGNVEAIRLYNSFGEFETEQPNEDALNDWFIDNIGG